MHTQVPLGTSSFTAYIVFDPVCEPVLARPGVGYPVWAHARWMECFDGGKMGDLDGSGDESGANEHSGADWHLLPHHLHCV